MAIKNGNVVQAKTGTIARTDLTNTYLFTIPAGAQIVRVTASGVVSNAGTTASVNVLNIPIGSTSASAVSVADVKTSAQAVGTLVGIANTKVSVPQQIYATYSETGAGASAGGPYTVLVEYL